MIVIEYPNGDLEVPSRAETEGAIGDGTQRINSSHLDYARWQTVIRRGIVDVQKAEEQHA